MFTGLCFHIPVYGPDASSIPDGMSMGNGGAAQPPNTTQQADMINPMGMMSQWAPMMGPMMGDPSMMMGPMGYGPMGFMGPMGPMGGMEPRPKEIITLKSLTLYPPPPSKFHCCCAVD